MRHAFNSIVSPILITLLPVTAALAQEAEEAAPKSYVASYFIVGLGVALGLVAVCRAAKRHKEVRRPE